MTTETPEAQPTEPDGTPTPTPDATPEGDPTAAPTPDSEPTPEVPAETGTASGGTEVSDEERQLRAEQAEQASLTPRERAQERRQEREEQLAGAGLDPQGENVSLAASDVAPTDPAPTEVGQQQVDLTLDQQVALRSLPNAATAVDGQGIERVVVPDLNADGWTPNPVEPDPREVARVQAMQAALAAKAEDRQAAMQAHL